MARSPLRVWRWLLPFSLATALLYMVLPRVMHGQSGSTSSTRSASPTVPVVAAPARFGDIAVYLTGLGTAVPLNSVTVRSRVDGQLITVAFREGQDVHQGDLLAELDPRPFQVQLTQAQGQVAKDEATLKNAQLDLLRYQELYAKLLIPKQQLDTQIATINQYEGALESDRGQIDSARLNLAYTRITAPISGRIGLRLVDPGNIVHASDQNGLVVIAQVDPIAVVFTIAEDSLGPVLRRLRAGQHLQVEAYDRELKTKIATGTLLTIDNEIDQTTGTVKLKAQFPNSRSGLFPNQFVNARLIVDTLRHAVIVPAAAVQRSPQSMFVYVVKPDHTVDARTVSVRLTEGDDAAIAGGLSAGELVVTDGVDKLQQGTQVTVQQAADAASTVHP